MTHKPTAPSSARPGSAGKSRTQAGVAKRRTCSTPPYNPGLQTLVEGKQAWMVSLTREAKENGFRGWYQRGYLPHCDVPWVTQMVTLRLADSLPANRRGEWELLLRIADTRESRRRLEAYLDLGHGTCWLRQTRVAKLAEEALKYFDGEKYSLAAWVIMPQPPACPDRGLGYAPGCFGQILEGLRLSQGKQPSGPWRRVLGARVVGYQNQGRSAFDEGSALYRRQPGEGRPGGGGETVAMEQRAIAGPVRPITIAGRAAMLSAALEAIFQAG